MGDRIRLAHIDNLRLVQLYLSILVLSIVLQGHSVWTMRESSSFNYFKQGSSLYMPGLSANKSTWITADEDGWRRLQCEMTASWNNSPLGLALYWESSKSKLRSSLNNWQIGWSGRERIAHTIPLEAYQLMFVLLLDTDGLFNGWVLIWCSRTVWQE